jgi:hypothetical protein
MEVSSLIRKLRNVTYRNAADRGSRLNPHSSLVNDASNAELEQMRAMFQETRDALLHTQDVLHQHQIASGLIDRTSGTPVARDRSIPSVLLLAPPKTAGSYIMHTLLHGLRLERRWVSLGYFGSTDLFRHWVLDQFWRDRACIAFQHTECNDANLFFLQQTDLRLLLNVRDPRQCLLSLVHYSLRHFPRQIKILHPAEPPEDYPEWGFERQIDWQIDRHMPNYVAWIFGWLNVIDGGKVEALITTFDDLLADEEAFFDRILNYYGIPREKFTHPHLAKDAAVNFRKGDPNEWREVFTAEQKRRCRAMIPDWMMARFCWAE